MSAAVDEDARKKIHEAGGTKSLFEWYTDMDPIVQLEALAALVRIVMQSLVCVVFCFFTRLCVCLIDGRLILRCRTALPQIWSQGNSVYVFCMMLGCKYINFWVCWNQI